MIKWSAQRRLTADFIWTLAANLVYAASQWGIVVILAKLGSAEQVGEYALGMAVSAPIVLFSNLQLRALMVSDIEGRFSFGQYRTFRLVSLAIAMVAVAVAAVAADPSERMRGIILLVGFAQALEFLSDAYYGLMQTHQRMDRVAMSLLIKGPLALAALWGAMYISHTVLWAVTGLILGRLAVFLVWDSHLGLRQAQRRMPQFHFEWDRKRMLALFRTAVPLGVISMLLSLNSNIPRYFVEGFTGKADLGVYSAIASLLTAGSLVMNALGQSLYLPVAEACTSLNRSKYRAYGALGTGTGMVLGIGAVLTAWLFGKDLLTRIFRPEYGAHADLLVRLMLAGTLAFAASGLGYVITAARSFYPQVPLLLCAAAAATGVSGWAVPRYGSMGAADAVLAASLVQLLGTGLIFLRVDRRLRSAAQTPQPSRAAGSLQSMEIEAR